jgi:hypothetical protein
MTDIDTLFQQVDTFPYADTMKPVKNEIPGRAFFPVGNGTFNINDKTISDKDVMILGQDFDCDTNFCKVVQAGQEDIKKNPTWRNLLSFLESVDTAPDNCFFTNAILGVRKGDIGTGKSPAFKDKSFIQNCQKFLLFQLEIQKPKAIFVLGKYVAQFLASTSQDLNFWNRIPNFAAVDKERRQIISATFDNGIKSNLVLLTHPSYRPVNVHRRTYLQYFGHDAEIEMTKAIL